LDAGEIPEGDWKSVVAALVPQARMQVPDIGS